MHSPDTFTRQDVHAITLSWNIYYDCLYREFIVVRMDLLESNNKTTAYNIGNRRLSSIVVSMGVLANICTLLTLLGCFNLQALPLSSIDSLGNNKTHIHTCA